MSSASYVVNVQQFGKLIFRGVVSKKGKNAEALKIAAKENATYVVTDVSGKPVTKAVIKQKGPDLLVFLDETDTQGVPDFVIENYAEVQRSTVIGTKTEAGFIEFLPASAPAGSFDLASGAPLALKADDGLWSASSIFKSPWFVPGAVLAVAGVAAVTKSSSDSTSASSSALTPLTTFALASSSAGAPDIYAYEKAGISDVNSLNLALVNSGVQRVKAATADDIKKVVAAAAKILAEANGTAADNTTNDPELADYKALGMTLSGIDDKDTTQLGLLTDIIKQRLPGDVNSVAKLEALASITEKLMTNAEDGNPAAQLTLTELQSIGLADLTANSLPGYLSAIRASANDGSQIKSFSALKAISDAYLKIFNLADGNRGNADSSKLPTLADYATAGVVLPDNIKNDTTGNALKLLNDTLDGLGSTLVSKVLRVTDSDANNNVTDLAVTLGKVMQIRAAADLTAATAVGLTAAELNGLLGSTTVTSGSGATGNLDAIVAALHASKSEPAFDAHAKLFAAVSLGVVMKYADSALGDSSRVAPTLAQYQAIGLASADSDATKAVNAGNLALLNSAVEALSGSDVNSKDKIQGVLNAYMKIVDMADGNRDGDTASLADYLALGALKNYDSLTGAVNGTVTSKAAGTGTQSGVALSLINSVVDGRTALGVASPGVVSVSDLNKIAIVVDKVLDLAALEPAANTTVTLTTTDLATLGLTGVTNANLSKILENIKAVTLDTAVDTVPELQSLVSLSSIQLYAADRSQAVPTLQTYKDLQLKDVTWDGNNLVSAVNDALPPSSTSVTTDKLTTLAVSYQSILKEAGDSTGVNADPTKEHYEAILGMSHLFSGSATNPAPAYALSLMNEVVRRKSSTALIDVDVLEDLADKVDQLMKTASETSTTVTKTNISFADLSVLGFNTNGWTNFSNPNKINKVNELIRDTLDTGEGVKLWTDIQNTILNSPAVLNA